MGEPTPEQVKAGIAGVFDRAAATYDQVGVEFFRPVGRFLVEQTAPAPGERVLDLGCGRGASALPAAEAVGAGGSVLATDLAPAMVDAVRRAAADLPWLRAEVGDAEEPPAGPFDLVQASLVLFFLPDLDRALEGYRRALAPGGRLGFTWFGEDDRRWAPVFAALQADIPEERRPRPPGSDGPFSSVSAMHQHLEERGWSDVRTETRHLEVRLRDADHLFEWNWSQGYRFAMERLQAEGLLDAARERVSGVLADLADEAGGITWRAEVHATVAR